MDFRNQRTRALAGRYSPSISGRRQRAIPRKEGGGEEPNCAVLVSLARREGAGDSSVTKVGREHRSRALTCRRAENVAGRCSLHTSGSKTIPGGGLLR